MEAGVRTHCKFVRKPVQELVYQLSATDHLIFSPVPQTSLIKCINGTNERIHIGKSARIHLNEGCTVKTQKHTIVSDIITRISPAPLQYSWSWDPFELPSRMLTDPEHLDHMLYEVRKSIYGLHRNLSESETEQKVFDAMLVESNLKFNYTTIFIWLALALSSTAIFALFCVALYSYLTSNRQQKQYPSEYYPEANYQDPKHSNSINIPIREIQQLTNMMRHSSTPVNMNTMLSLK
jgi:hypothetical protein